jgi:hypothetical protein
LQCQIADAKAMLHRKRKHMNKKIQTVSQAPYIVWQNQDRGAFHLVKVAKKSLGKNKDSRVIFEPMNQI